MTESTNGASARGGVVIGLDGSTGSRHALQWLVNHRELVSESIVPVMAYELPVTADGLSPIGMVGDADSYAREAEQALRSEIKTGGPSLAEVDAVLCEGRPGAVLVDEAEKHGLLVVGCRGRSAITEIVLGSVGSYAVMNSATPVIVIPREADAQKTISRIVVGIDGSENSQAALQWAIDRAPEGCAVDAIGVYSTSTWMSLGMAPNASELESECDRMVSEVIAKVRPSETKVNTVSLEGDPRNTLRTEGEKADLIVLGSRGHQGVAHLLLGSVATSLTHHPTAATVVVPA